MFTEVLPGTLPKASFFDIAQKVKTTIVIVRDNNNNDDLLDISLILENYDVIVYDNVLSSLNNFYRDKADIIISDLTNAQMSNVDYCVLVKKKCKHKYFIILSDNLAIEDKVNALRCGADDYITKPFDFKEFIARINAAKRIITRQKYIFCLNDRLKKLSQMDELTNLCNRRFYQHCIKNEIKRAQRYKYNIGAMLLDLDHFKRVNDLYGHLVGDEVLKIVANILMENTRNSDIVCRYGGEEFLIFIPEVEPADLFIIAEKIRKKVERIKFKSENDTFSVTLSIGLSYMTPEEDYDEKLLTKLADKALYKAKRSGRNQTVIVKKSSISSFTGKIMKRIL